MLNLDHVKITRRDHEVLHLLVQGCSNKAIAAELNISPTHGKTAPAHAISTRRDQARTQARHSSHRNF